MNVMLDPMMALNLTPVHGGLVIILGDDPGGYGSQNDQDTRPLVTMLEMPLLEPATPAQAFAMMLDAFGLSERFRTPVIVRETRSFSQTVGRVEIPDGPIRARESGADARAVAVRSGARECRRETPGPARAARSLRSMGRDVAVS